MMSRIINKAFKVLKFAAANNRLISYQDFAAEIGISNPPIIKQATQILEQMMDLDVQNLQPILASIVVQKNGSIPRPGFFNKLYELGVTKNVLQGEEASRWHQAEVKKVKQWIMTNENE